jgi:hypothetical protein
MQGYSSLDRDEIGEPLEVTHFLLARIDVGMARGRTESGYTGRPSHFGSGSITSMSCHCASVRSYGSCPSAGANDDGVGSIREPPSPYRSVRLAEGSLSRLPMGERIPAHPSRRRVPMWSMT